MGRLPSGAVLGLGSLCSPAGTKALIAHFAGGARNVARDIVGELSPSFVRAPVLAFFRRQNKWAGLFPSAAYCRSAPPRLAVSKLKRMSVGMLRRALNISQTKRPAQVQIRAGLSASHEACRRMAAFSIQLTESHTEPASHGACCATAVKPRPSRMSLYTPARQRRAEKGAGHSPASWMRPSSCRRMRLPVRGSPSSVGAEQVLEMWKR